MNLKDVSIHEQSLLLLIIGVLLLVFHLMSISFNICLTIVLYRNRKEFFANPFYKIAPHLIMSEVGTNLLMSFIIPPCLLFPDLLDQYYERMFETEYVAPSAVLLVFYDSYYYFQLIVSLYRLWCIRCVTEFTNSFTNIVIHTLMGLVWIYGLCEGYFMVSGSCQRVFRPKKSSIEITCPNELEAEDPGNFRLQILQLFQKINIIVPALSLLMYVTMFVRIKLHTSTCNDSQRRPSVFWILLTRNTSNSKEISIIYQGLALLLLMALYPASNYIFDFFMTELDDYKNPFYICVAYLTMYIFVACNFFTFYVFNKRIRTDVNNLFQCRKDNKIAESPVSVPPRFRTSLQVFSLLESSV